MRILVYRIFIGIYTLNCLLYLDHLFAMGVAKEKVTTLALLAFVLIALIVTASPKWPRFQGGLLYTLFILLLLEGCLQIVAAFGMLPKISFSKNLPHARIHWAKEGFSNTMMNRYGWHYPEVDTKKESIAIIGDSFIEAKSIDKHHHMGKVLESKFNGSPALQVCAFGISGTGPAQYLEILKYANRYFNLSEVVLVIFSGNDLVNLMEKRHNYPPKKYLYYDLREDRLELDDDAHIALSRFHRERDLNHSGLIHSLAPLLRNHIITPKFFRELSRAIRGKHEYRRGYREELLRNDELPEVRFACENKLEKDALDAYRMLSLIVQEAQKYCDQHGIKLNLAHIPHNPTVALDQPVSVKRYLQKSIDFLKPERFLKELCASHAIPFYGFGEDLVKRIPSEKEIRSLYELDGKGHLNAKGHRFFGERVYKHFYSPHDTRGL